MRTNSERILERAQSANHEQALGALEANIGTAPASLEGVEALSIALPGELAITAALNLATQIVTLYRDVWDSYTPAQKATRNEMHLADLKRWQDFLDIFKPKEK